MKKYAMVFAVAALVTGVSVNAEEAAAATQKNQVVATAAKVEVKLSADEQSFAATLSEQSRKSFCDNLSSEQRQAVMVAAKNGANGDEAVHHLLTAKEMKSSHIVDASK